MSEHRERAYEVATADRLIAILNNGDDGAAITADYRALVQKLGDPLYGDKRKGEITIKLSFHADAKGVDVTIDHKVKEPSRPKFKDKMFIADSGDTLTTRNPARSDRQLEMYSGQDHGRAHNRGV